MQIVSIGDNLQEMSKPVFWEKLEKYHQVVVCWISPDSCKGKIILCNQFISIDQLPEAEI